MPTGSSPQCPKRYGVAALAALLLLASVPLAAAEVEGVLQNSNYTLRIRQ